MKIIAFEGIATWIFVLLAVGAGAVCGVSLGTLGTAAAFGLSMFLALICLPVDTYRVSVNPAISLSLFIDKKIDVKEFFSAIIGQIVGAVVAVFFVKLLVEATALGGIAYTGLVQNGYFISSPVRFSALYCFIAEVVFTFILIFIFLITGNKEISHIAFAAIQGLCLFSIFLLLLPLDGGGTNPARSIATAVFIGKEALSQLWLFVVAPFVGSILATIAFIQVRNREL